MWDRSRREAAGRIEGEAAGKIAGRIEGEAVGKIAGKKEVLLEILEEKGEITGLLKKKIHDQNDMTILKSWIQKACMTDSIEEFENDVNGINKSTDNYKVNLENVSTGDNKNVTTASPKLNITLPKVSYNKDTGILTF